MKTCLLRLVLWVLVCGHFSAWAGINEDLLAAAKASNSEEIERLLGVQADVSAQNAESDMALHLVAASGNRKAVELLLAHHANVNASNRFGYTPLHVAAYWKHNEIVQLLLEKGAEVHVISASGATPLCRAVTPIDDVSASEFGGIASVLTPAAAMANKQLVELLLANGAKVNVKTNDGITPLHLAAVLGVPDIVELLIARGAEVNSKGDDGYASLYLAAKYDRKDVAEILLAHQAVVEQKTAKGDSPLSIAAAYGNRPTAELLLRHGANPNIKDKRGLSPLWLNLKATNRFYALASPALGGGLTSDDKEKLSQARKQVKGEWQAVARLLVEHGADLSEDNSGNGPLYMAATTGDRELVELMLAKGARVSGGLSECACETPLHSAIAEHHPEVAGLLINHGANVNARNPSKRTPLHFLAVYIHDGKLAELMIAQGADVNAREKTGETPYDAAVRAGNQEVAAVLQQHGVKTSVKAPVNSKMDELNRMLDSGRSPDQPLPDGATLLTTMVAMGDKALVERLLEKGANVNVKGTNGIPPLIAVFIMPMMQTPLGLVMAKQANAPKELIESMRKMQGQWREIALLLINKGADINVKAPNNGMTPLHYAASLNYRDVAEMLLAKGADINARDVESRTPLYFAIMADAADMVGMLLDKGADNDAAGIVGVTLLHLAIASGQDENGKSHGSRKTAELLIARGADVNAKTRLGNTPLHGVAKYTGEAEMAKLLIEKGAEVNALDSDSHTPLFYAAEMGNMEMVNILIQHGALK
ncbi:MAG: ankyrin repeat domain-containing protein [Gallionella sp.]|nr:ankyrin repeat domain-containing protein [Gallionella sp.]